MGSGGLHLKMAINNLLLLSSIFATVPGLPPAQPTTTTEASVKSRTNGLINDVKEINLFLNIPKGCDIVYDGLIKQLEGCRSGPRRSPSHVWLFAQAGLHSPPAGLRQHRPFLPRRQIRPHTPRGSLQRHLLPNEWKADIQRRCRDERGIPQGGGGAGSQA